MQKVDDHPLSLLMWSASRLNVLPVSGRCNLRCVYCSHQGNPPELLLPRLPIMTKDELAEAIRFLDPARKIVIGESATRISEGEPLLYPEIWSVLEEIRRLFPDAVIQITTNGTFLDEGVAQRLAELKPLELVVSVNSVHVESRRRLMGDPHPERILSGLENLAKWNVAYTGSMVLIPAITGWEDITTTIEFLADRQCLVVRCLMPGFTRWTPPAVARCCPQLEEWQAVKPRVRAIGEKSGIPVTTEPAIWSLDPERRLSARIAGIIAGSPADQAGLRGGDEVIAVGSGLVGSRVDAFEKVRNARDPAVQVRRQGQILNSRILKAPNSASGLVFDYDLPLSQVQQIQRLAADPTAMLLTSELAAPLIQAVFEQADGDHRRVQVAANEFWGGNIACAGLLTVGDLARTYRVFREQEPGMKIRRLLVPGRGFDHYGRDIQGINLYHLQDVTGVPVRCAQ